jgi:hypothetical protein
LPGGALARDMMGVVQDANKGSRRDASMPLMITDA